MSRKLSPLLALLLAAQAALTPAAARPQDAAHTARTSAPPAQVTRPPRPLTNEDVLGMVEAKLAPEVVVEKLKASPCDFDASPEALARLRDAGAPDALLLALAMLPECDARPARRVAVRVPAGTTVELETAYTIDSQLVRAGDLVSFRVVNPVVVGGQVVVEKGASATAVVTKAERGGHFGRAGRIAWTMKEVTAADGSRIPVRFSGRAVGDSKGAKVATRVALTGLVLWPIAPVALFHGFKRGENAVVPEGKRFDATVADAATVHIPARP
jgi:hypothetical protein